MLASPAKYEPLLDLLAEWLAAEIMADRDAEADDANRIPEHNEGAP